jgi:hypothetical protein
MAAFKKEAAMRIHTILQSAVDFQSFIVEAPMGPATTTMSRSAVGPTTTMMKLAAQGVDVLVVVQCFALLLCASVARAARAIELNTSRVLRGLTEPRSACEIETRGICASSRKMGCDGRRPSDR